MAKIFFMFYNSVIMALLCGFVSFRSVWLEMRVNVGILIPVYAVIIFAIFFFVLRHREYSGNKYKLFTVANLIVSAIASTFVLGVRSLGVAPAAIIREGLGITHIKFSYINAALCAFIVSGLIIILIRKVNNEN